MRGRFRAWTVAMIALLLAQGLGVGAAIAGCGRDAAAAFGCDTNDVINCGIAKVHELRLLQESPEGYEQQQLDAALLEILDISSYGASDKGCGSSGFVGWAWTNALLAVIETMVHEGRLSSEVVARLEVELPTVLDPQALCSHATSAPLQDTAAEQLLGDYLLAELSMLLGLGRQDELDETSARCLGLAMRVSGGAERSILRVPEHGHALVFNHQQENPFYGFAVLNALAVARGVASQFGAVPAHEPDPGLVAEIYAWLDQKSRHFTTWQEPFGLVAVKAGAAGGSGLGRLEPIGGDGGCLDTSPGRSGWPGQAGAVDEHVWAALASCYSPDQGVASDCDAGSWEPVRATSCRDLLGYPPCFAATIEHLVGVELDQCDDLEAELATVPPRYKGSLRAKHEVYYRRWGHDALVSQWADLVDLESYLLIQRADPPRQGSARANG